MAAHGVTTFVEIGPGKVLSGLIKRIASGAETRNVNSAASVAA
jgi:[acyl-carrier-protein] S-malonyltransferase